MAVNIIITEKPDASKKIAEALADKTLKKKERRGAYWFEFKKGRDDFYILPAVGHLYALDTVKDGSGWNYPTFETRWIPSFKKKGSEFSEKYFKNMESIIDKHSTKDDANFIIATDYDTEGSVIGYNILKMMGGREDAQRMKYSTLTKDELLESWETRSKNLDLGQVESGLTRHFLDFYWGINLTRALSLAYKNAAEKGFAVLSTGRVQGPTLSFIYDRELKIRGFVPKPFWQVVAILKADEGELEAEYEKSNIWDKKEAEEVHKAAKKTSASGVVKNVNTRKYRQSPPVPFNTTEMQTEAYAQFKYSPRQTLSIVETLYQAGYVSYPRSSSQRLPPSINYSKIMGALSKLGPYSKHTRELMKKKNLKPNEGNKTDPAHPAIYPTSETPDLESMNYQQRRMYDLIVRRFLSVFADDAIRESVTAELDINGYKFIASGKSTVEPGWTKIYEKYLSFKERLLPKIEKGDELPVISSDLEEKETQPPGRFSQGSILKEMEKHGLGTRATRAEILQTLYNRKYVSGKSIEVTDLGEVVVTVLKENCPRILSEELTRKFEEEMEAVNIGKRNRKQVLEEAKRILKEILDDFKKNENLIGEKLLKGLVGSRAKERSMGPCPKCGEELRMIVSKKSGKRFIGCSNYPKCSNAFPLPQKGYITKLDKVCKDCGMQMIQIKRQRGRAYQMCINHECKTKEDWGKKGNNRTRKFVKRKRSTGDKKRE
ncbi:MAG: DNA topoisomerase I [Kosmotogaceae bacterium]|nr:DNA topoisomerase I [Kosmotogaceae bacterium]